MSVINIDIKSNCLTPPILLCYKLVVLEPRCYLRYILKTPARHNLKTSFQNSSVKSFSKKKSKTFNTVIFSVNIHSVLTMWFIPQLTVSK